MTISYTVAIADAAAHLIDVTLQVENLAPDGQLLTLPNWIPGSYMIRDFSRNIIRIEAWSSGQPVVLDKRDKSSWLVPSGLRNLEVRYTVYAWDLSVRAAHVDENHAFFNGTSVFLCVNGMENERHEVVFDRPEHDVDETFELSTAMRAVNADKSGFGLYSASDYDELIDHPVEQGAFKKLEFTACGVPHEVVLTGACHFDERRVCEDLAKICEYQIRFFAEPAPVDRYVFMVMVVDAGYGGLEHRASTALMITRENLPMTGDKSVSDKYLDFLGLCSHEYFHTWNVKRIKPARFVPYALHDESYTNLLWFFEGMTSYYDDLVLVRTGLIDQDRYLGLVSKTLTRVQRGAGRTVQSVTDSSFDAWHKFYKQDENAPNAIVSYYAKGALIALCLDSLMRQASHGDVRLDTLMRALWQKWLEGIRGVGEEEPQQLAATLCDTDLSDFFTRALSTTEELPVVDCLANLGVELLWQPRMSSADMGGTRNEIGKSDVQPPESTTPWFGATINDAPGGVRISQIMQGGPAADAGLSAGDVVVAINTLSVSKADVDNHLQRHADLAEVSVHYFRLGQLYETLLPIRAAPMDTAVLRIVDNQSVGVWLNDSRLADAENAGEDASLADHVESQES